MMFLQKSNNQDDEEWRIEMLKYLLMAYNMVIFCFAGILLGVSIWMAVERSFLSHIIGNDLYAVAIYLGLSCAAVIFFVSIIGCGGAVSEKKMVLYVFAAILCFMAVMLLITGILAGVFRAQIGDSVKKSMRNTLLNKYDVDLHKRFNRAVTHAWDKAQQRLYCCGVDDNGWELYRKSRWFQQYGAMDEVRGLRYGHEGKKPYVPESCCVTDRFWKYLDRQNCQKWKLGPPGSLSPGAINRALYYDGCFNAGVKYMKENTAIIVGLGISLSAILVVGIVLTLMLLRRL